MLFFYNWRSFVLRLCFLSLTFSIRSIYTEQTDKNYLDELILKLEYPKGVIQGRSLESEAGRRYYAFEGIPYAAYPWRFQEPQEHEGWKGLYQADINNVACMQDINWDIKKRPNVKITEDCLLINVYTPVHPGRITGLRPVLFWIHSGGFINEFGAMYDPKYFMDHGVIVVTFNYRLGPFGFLTTEDGVIPANLGLKDQQYALEWVLRNIHLFGGNLLEITIGGSSSGAASVSYHILNQQNDGYFQAAIMQSGTSMNTWAFTTNARETAFELARTVNPDFKSTRSADVLALLQNVSAADLNQAANDMKLSSSGGTPWLPTVEDPSIPGAYITKPMHEAFIESDFCKVPIMIGFTSVEALYIFKDPAILQIQAEATDDTPSLIVDKYHNINIRNENLAGTEIRSVYTDSTFGGDLDNYLEALSNKLFTTAIMRQAELFLHHQLPVYLYQFSYSGIAGKILGKDSSVSEDGVGHGEDLYYMWDLGTNLTSKEDMKMRFVMLRLFTNFVKNLDPTPPTDEFLNNVTWPLTDTISFEYMNINKTLEVREYPKKYKRIRNLYEKYFGPPFMGF